MRIASVLENQKIEKRISITPEIAKKYISLGFEVILSENYGYHLGILDNEYKELGVNIQKDENEIIQSADIIVQLGLFSDSKKEILKENQTFIGVLDPYKNKEMIINLSKKKRLIFFFGIASKNYKSSVYGYTFFSRLILLATKAVIESFANFESNIDDDDSSGNSP